MPLLPPYITVNPETGSGFRRVRIMAPGPVPGLPIPGNPPGFLYPGSSLGSGVSLRVTQVKFWSNFDTFWFISLASRSKLKETLQKFCKSCNTLQYGLKIDIYIYSCKIIFFSPPGWTPPPYLGHGTTSRVPLASNGQ